MNEQFKGEQCPTPENIENQKYTAFQVAMDEEEKIMAEMNKIFELTQDRAEIEKNILEKYASQMDEAMKKSRKALDEWLRAIEESYEKEQK